MFEKYARAEILGTKGSQTQLGRTASLDKLSDFEDYRTDDNYIYTRVRAIASRVNKNADGWPSAELAKSYKTFLGRPNFVDHENANPRRARGVVVDAKLHVDEDRTSAALDPYYSHAPAEHLPPTWIELLIETDAQAFPKLAHAIASGEIDGVSMGANVERSKCSHCGNWATMPEEYCNHIRNKGAEFDYFRDGKKTSKKSYEDCYDINFFEISYVFDPADETALFLDKPRMAKTADTAQIPQSEMTVAPEKVDTLRQETICPVCGSEMDDGACPVCNYEEPPEGFGNPDLTKAQDTDQMQEQQNTEAGDAEQQSMQQTQQQQQPQQQPGMPIQPGMPATSRYNILTPTANVTSSRYAADLSGGRVNTKEKPLLPATRQTSDKPKNQKVIGDSTKPVESSYREEELSKTADTNAGEELAGGPHGDGSSKRVDVESVGGVDGNENPPGHKNVDVTGVGGVIADDGSGEQVDLDKGLLNEVGDPTMTWNGGKGDSAGQQNAVTGEKPVLGTQKKSLEILPAPAPEKVVDVTADVANEVGGPTKTWHTDPVHAPDNAVTQEAYPRPEEAVKPGETGDGSAPFPPQNEGVKNEKGNWGGDSDEKLGRTQYRTHMITAMKLAETEIALGITPEDTKYDRIAELEAETHESLQARLDTVSRVKTAGLAKKVTAAKRPQPSFQTQSALRSEPAEVEEDGGAEAIFVV